MTILIILVVVFCLPTFAQRLRPTGRGRRRGRWGASIGAVLLAAVTAKADTNTASIYLSCLINFETYAESIWHDTTSTNQPSNSGYWGDGGSSGNGGIRGSCGITVAYAVLMNALPGDPKNSNRLSHLTKALNYAANTHTTGAKTCVDGHKWGWNSGTVGTCGSSGSDWQTSEWSGSMGLACMLAQSNLPTQTILDCQRVINSEASHRTNVAPCSGYVSDTKAEENAWDSNIPAVASSWLSTNAGAAGWLACTKQYLVNSYTVANTNGDPLSSWVTTVTLFPSYALQNHGFYHPTYEMVAGMSLGDSMLMAKYGNPAIATQLQTFAEHNIMTVWASNLNCMVLNSGEFAYPAGLDWELHDYEQNSYITWLATHFNDPLARWADNQLAQLVRYRQTINGDGTFVGPSGGGFYREAVEARRTAIAWLHWSNALYTNGPVTPPAPTLAHFSDVQVLVQRSAASYVSLSYGSRIMAMIDAPPAAVPTNPYVATPLLPGVIGLGALGAPTSAQLVSLVTNTNGFFAELTLQNGANGSTEVYFQSTGDSVAVVEVPYPAEGVSGTPAGSFNVGIENDPLTGGSRLLEWVGGTATITNRSGASRNVSNNWVCVSGRYGIAAGPAGYFNYQAASGYNRLGAAEDTLQFVPQSLLGARYAVWFPGQTAAQTASNASQLQWTVSGTNAALTFPSAGGVQQITVALAPPPPPYTPYLLSISNITASSSQSGYPPTNAVDGNLSDFWVSSGTTAGQGPTTNKPEWLLVNFTRQCAVSEFQVYPRTLNGGYGPKNIQMLLNGTSVYSGTMAPTTTLDMSLSPPVYATNAELYITSSYDPNFPTNSRNVQVVELAFFERAPPGTFGDWALAHFTDAQLADLNVSGALADPDGDGVSNLAEFAMGGNPWSPDRSVASLKAAASTGGTFAFRFQERQNLGDVQRHYESSSNLVNWIEVTPTQTTIVSNLPGIYVKQVVFPAPVSSSYFRVKYVGGP